MGASADHLWNFFRKFFLHLVATVLQAELTKITRNMLQNTAIPLCTAINIQNRYNVLLIFIRFQKVHLQDEAMARDVFQVHRVQQTNWHQSIHSARQSTGLHDVLREHVCTQVRKM